MPEEKINEIASNADMIVKGYAFTRKEDTVSVFNLNDRESSMLISEDGTMLETNMDEIQQVIVLNIWQNDSKYLEL